MDYKISGEIHDKFRHNYEYSNWLIFFNYVMSVRSTLFIS